MEHRVSHRVQTAISISIDFPTVLCGPLCGLTRDVSVGGLFVDVLAPRCVYGRWGRIQCFCDDSSVINVPVMVIRVAPQGLALFSIHDNDPGLRRLVQRVRPHAIRERIYGRDRQVLDHARIATL